MQKPIDEPCFAAEALAYVVVIIFAIWSGMGGWLVLLDSFLRWVQ
jgi:hypothetical protein